MKFFRQVFRFGIVGVINTAIDFGLLNLLVAMFGWPVIGANTVSFSAAVLNSYFMNKSWTFRDKTSHTVMKFGGFIVVAFVGLLISDFFVWIFYDFYGLHYNLAKLISVAIVFIWNFFGSKYWIFEENTSASDTMKKN